MRALSSSDLIQILRSRGYKSPEVSRALGKFFTVLSVITLYQVMDKLKAEHDSEVSATSLRVSLICPVCQFSSELLHFFTAWKSKDKLSLSVSSM